MGLSNKLKLTLLSALIAVSTACTNATDTQANNPKDNYLTRDVRDDVFYFVMPDRFENGDRANDMGSTTISISSGGFDPTSTGHYHGGDLRGLINQLDYLQGMGITAIWMTPIMRNQAVQGDSSGYHGYWTLDFTQLDPHLGSNDDLKELIDAAHAKNMKVFFDIITNHTADVIKFEECHRNNNKKFSTDERLCKYVPLADKKAGKGYTPYVLEHEKQLKTPDWLNDPQYYNNQGDSTWQGESSINGDFMGLDDLDTSNPKVVSGMIDIYKDIIEIYKPDGFRIDTVKHVDMSFWQQFSPAIMEYAQQLGIPNFFVFGEVYSEDANVLSTFTTEGKIPSVLDFHLQLAIKNVFGRGQPTQALNELFLLDSLYKDDDSDADILMNFVSNHDMGRLGYFVEEAFPLASEQEKLARIKIAHAMMYFARGIPVVYYGDEQGFVGKGGDKGAREDMMPSKVELYNSIDLLGTEQTTADANFNVGHPLYQAFAEYAEIYKNNEALRRGKQEILLYSDNAGIFAFTRETKQQKLALIFNSATSPQTINNETIQAGKLLHGEVEKVSSGWAIPALSFAIIEIN